MAVLKILTQDDEFCDLRKPCKPVTSFDENLRSLVADMWDSMYAALGVGLAATQIGATAQVAVIDTIMRPNSNRRLVLVNPRITFMGGEQTQSEGCLSMPGLRWPITRAECVTVEFYDLQGKHQVLTARHLLARAIQHECDHLDGVLCNSKVTMSKQEVSG